VEKARDQTIPALHRGTDAADRLPLSGHWFDLAPVPMVVAQDPDCREVRANLAFRNLVGSEEAAPDSGDALHDLQLLTAGRRLDVVDSPLQRAARLGLTIDHQPCELELADGRRLDVIISAKPIIDGHGRPRGAIAVVLDVTEGIRLAHELEEREEWLRLSMEATGMGSFDADLTRNTVVWSPQLRTMLGIPADMPDETALDDIRRFVHPDDVPLLEAQFEASLDPAGTGDLDTVVRMRRLSDGSQRWLLVRGCTRFEVAPNEQARIPTRALGMVLDVTDSKRAEEERTDLLERERMARTEAERASRLKEEFLATVSHELRTPLSAITAWAHLLKMVPDDAEQTALGAEVIESSARAQAQLIADLLDMSRIISGQMRLDVAEVELCDIIEDALEALRPAAAGRGIRLRKRLEPLSDKVHGDATRIRQVLWNLVSNAIKFTPKGGRVEVALRDGQAHAEIIVSDNGRGFPADLAPQLFERFRQIEKPGAGTPGGLGLGLSIVKELVEMHGGRVRAESSGEGHGASFTVELPYALQDMGDSGVWTIPEALHLEPAAEVQRLDGVRILVVDDHAESLEVVGRLLRNCGARVVLARDADEAELLARRHPVDIVICDIGLPGRDGYQLIQALRQAGIRAPAAALTAFARETDRARALEAGFDAHIAKPVQPVDLLAIVAALAGSAA